MTKNPDQGFFYGGEIGWAGTGGFLKIRRGKQLFLYLTQFLYLIYVAIKVSLRYSKGLSSYRV